MLKYIIAFLLLLPSTGWGWHLVGSGVSAAGGSTTYVGYPNTGGVPSSTPASSAGAVSTLLATKWTAATSGTLVSLNAYIADRTSPTINSETLVVYKDISGTLTLIATGAYTGVASAWTGAVTLTAVSGQSLSFASGADLYFGGAATSTNDYKFGRNDSGGTGMWYEFSDYTTGPPSTVTLDVSGDRQMAFILGYQ